MCTRPENLPIFLSLRSFFLLFLFLRVCQFGALRNGVFGVINSYPYKFGFVRNVFVENSL